MPVLNIILDGDGCWPDAHPDQAHVMNCIEHGAMSVALLRGGMESGAHSVTFRIDAPDGRIVLAQTSLALFLNAARMFQARLEYERDNPSTMDR